MDTKAAFEKWAIDNGFSIQFDTDNNEYSHASTRNAFRGFTGGRETIEIEMPELAVDHDERLRVETSVEGAFNLGVIRSRQAITSHGIRIKGKTE